MADPTDKRFEIRKTVNMTAAFAKAIEREAKQQRISEGELMRRWLEAGRCALEQRAEPLINYQLASVLGLR